MDSPNTPQEADQPPESPAESLAIVEEAMGRARAELGVHDSVVCAVWGTVWLVAFGFTHLVVGGGDPVLGQVPGWAVGTMWLLAIGAGVIASSVYYARHTRALSGRSSRMGARIGVAWMVAMVTTSALIAPLGLAGHEIGALFVFAVALLFLGQGSVFLDDVQLGLGVWLAALNVVALALGPEVYALLLALAGGGALLVGGLLTRRRELRGSPAHVG